jgi:uridine kinase
MYMNKNALLISGYIRGFKDVIANMKTYLLDKNNFDIYIHITNDNDIKYNNIHTDLNFIRDTLQPIMMIYTSNIKFNEDTIQNDILNQNYKFWLLNEERKRKEQNEDIKYKNVMKIRPDLNLQSYINLDCTFEDCIYIPNDCKNNTQILKPSDMYLCDVIAYGNSSYMNKYFNMYNHLDYLMAEYTNVNEVLLYHYFHRECIKYEKHHIDYIVVLSICNIIAISGDSGSGKTTISNIINTIYTDSFVLECDRYHKWERNDVHWEKYSHLNPDANYILKMEQDVFDLKFGNYVMQVDYDHTYGKFTKLERIDSKDNIIVCGLHCLVLPNNLINCKIYVDTDKRIQLFWKMKRDCMTRGYDIDKVMKQISHREPDLLKYILPQMNEADIIINYYTNDDDYTNEPIIHLRIGFRETLVNVINIFNKNKRTIRNNYVYVDFETNYELKNILSQICKQLDKSL